MSAFIKGTLVSDTGVMQTQYVVDGQSLPAGAVVLDGIAHAQTGERYVASWPSSGSVFYSEGRAVNSVGAQVVLDSAGVTPATYVNGVGMTARGEALVTMTGTPRYVAGIGVTDTGAMLVSNPGFSLNLDFLSGSLDSRITFSRGTQAMQYGQDGTLQYAPNNLLTYSNQADNAAWTKSNSFVQTNLLLYSNDWSQAAWSKANVTVTASAAIGPDGTMSMTKLAATTAAATVVTQAVVSTSTSMTYSIYVRQGSGATDANLFYFRNYTTSTNLAGLSIDYSSGVITQTIGTGATAVAVGNGIWRISIPVTAGITVGDTIIVYSCFIGNVETAGKYAYTYGAQVVQGSVPGDYRATTSAALPVLYADYNGALRARKLCEDATATAQHRVFNAVGITYAASTQICFSAYAKSGERSFAYIRVNNSGGDLVTGYVNLVTGEVTNVVGGTITTVNALSGWWRISATSSSTSATAISTYIGAATASGTNVYTGDGSSGIYIADAQLTPGYLPLAVTETTSAAVYGPRFDYDPVTKVARGLLIEEQRTNLATFSNTFSDASWVAFGTKNVAASAIISPESVANAWTLTDGSAVAIDGIQKNVTVAADGTTYTASIYVLKTSGGTSTTFGVNIGISGGTAVSNNARFNTDTGAVLNGTATVTNAGLWWRVACSVTNNSSVGNTTLNIGIFPATAAYNSGVDVVTATGSATIYGAQIETGAFATSYIPTVASTATRNADSASITTLTPWYNQSEGTLYSSFTFAVAQPNFSTAPRFFGLVSNDVAGFYTSGGGTTISGQQRVGGIAVYQQSLGSTQIGTFGAALAYGATDCFALNGALATQTAGSTAGAMTALVIGNQSDTYHNLTGQIWVRSIRYYPTRLPNASLQSITA